MLIKELYSTQKNLRRKEQIGKLVEAIKENYYIDPVLLSENDDGTIQIENGHHRVIAYHLAGRIELKQEEYFLIKGETNRPRIQKVLKLAL